MAHGRRSRKRGAQTLGLNLWMLGMDSAAVIGLRSIKLAMGGAGADKESRLMIAEKLAAAAQLPLVLAGSAATSPSGVARTAVRHYATKVRANRRRLSGSAGKAR